MSKKVFILFGFHFCLFFTNLVFAENVTQPAFFASDVECSEIGIKSRQSFFERTRQDIALSDGLKHEIRDACNISNWEDLPEIVYARVLRVDPPKLAGFGKTVVLKVLENLGRVAFPEQVTYTWPPSGDFADNYIEPKAGEMVIIGFNNESYTPKNGKIFDGFVIPNSRRIATPELIKHLREFNIQKNSRQRFNDISSKKKLNESSPCNPGYFLLSAPSDELIDVLPEKDCEKHQTAKANPIQFVGHISNLTSVGFKKGMTVGAINALLKECQTSIYSSHEGTAILNVLIPNFKAVTDFEKLKECFQKSKYIEFVIKNVPPQPD
jgi:hypothetical protein